MKFYVYYLVDPRDDSIFYVGKGCKQRMFSHVKVVSKGGVTNNNQKLTNKIKELLNENYRIKHRKIFETDNEEDAYNKEKEEIEKIGLENLYNMTSGGVGGTDYLLGILYKNRYGEERSIEIKKKIGIANSIALKGKSYIERFGSEEKAKEVIKKIGSHKRSEKSKKNMSEKMKGRVITWGDKISKAKRGVSIECRKGIPRSKETKEKISNTLKGHIGYFTGKHHTEETKTKISESHKGHIVTEETKEKIIEGLKKYWEKKKKEAINE